MKKKSVAKAKIFFLLKVSGQLQLSRECSTAVCFIQRKPIVAPLLTDRYWSVAVKVGKRIWLGLSRMLESPAQKFGETNCENPFACEHTLSRGPSALYFLHETHAKRQKSTFPTSRMGVARGRGPHLQPGRLKKLQKIFRYQNM